MKSIIRLDAEESLKMAEAILNPREANANLCAAAKRYIESHRSEARLLPGLSHDPEN